MTIDLVLAILHFILAFGLVALLMGEAILVRPGMSPMDLERAGRIDIGYGVSAGLILVVGLMRVFMGAKGEDYYLANPWFWAKMGSFAVIGLLSIPPTLRFIAWRRLRARDPEFVPGEEEILAVQRLIWLESIVLLLVIVFASTMARYG